MEVITMEKIILIKYGELTTKKANRNLFINRIYAVLDPYARFDGKSYIDLTCVERSAVFIVRGDISRFCYADYTAEKLVSLVIVDAVTYVKHRSYSRVKHFALYGVNDILIAARNTTGIRSDNGNDSRRNDSYYQYYK